jgi:hypothetical protein
VLAALGRPAGLDAVHAADRALRRPASWTRCRTAAERAVAEHVAEPVDARRRRADGGGQVPRTGVVGDQQANRPAGRRAPTGSAGRPGSRPGPAGRHGRAPRVRPRRPDPPRTGRRPRPPHGPAERVRRPRRRSLSAGQRRRGSVAPGCRATRGARSRRRRPRRGVSSTCGSRRTGRRRPAPRPRGPGASRAGAGRRGGCARARRRRRCGCRRCAGHRAGAGRVGVASAAVHLDGQVERGRRAANQSAVAAGSLDPVVDAGIGRQDHHVRRTVRASALSRAACSGVPSRVISAPG